MVRRSVLVVLASLLWGCPDDLGGGLGNVVTGLRSPTDLEGIPNGGSEVVLTWKDRASGEDGYRLEMNSVPFGTPVIGGVEYLPADATSFVYPAVPNSTYYFRVFAITSAMESEPSNVIVVSTPNVPHRPDGVVARTDSTTQITVKWGDLMGETGYRVEVSANGGSTWVNGTVVGPDSSQGQVSSLLPDAEYQFRVVAFNAQGDSTPSLPALGLTMSNLVSFTYASAADTGKCSSYQITPAGVEHLSQFDVANTNVLYTTRSAPGAYSTITLDAGAIGPATVGADGTSIAVDGAGKVHVVAHDQTNGLIRYTTNASGIWVATTIESHPVGANPQILWDPVWGTLHVYYTGMPIPGSTVLRQAWKKPGEPWKVMNFPVATDHSTRFSISMNSGGRRDVVFISPQRELWHSPTVGPPDPAHPFISQERIPLPTASSAPDFTACVAGAGGAVHVVFHDASNASYHHATNASGTWVTEPVEENSGQDMGGFCALAYHPATGRLHTAYYDATNRDLRYARKDPGKAWIRKVLDVAGDVGSHASIALDSAGVVRIAYRDETNQRLKIATGAP